MIPPVRAVRDLLRLRRLLPRRICPPTETAGQSLMTTEKEADDASAKETAEMKANSAAEDEKEAALPRMRKRTLQPQRPEEKEAGERVADSRTDW